MTLAELEDFISGCGKEQYRARQLMKWMYQSGIDNFDEMTNLSREFRRTLQDLARISSLEIEEIQTSADGTKKALFRLSDGFFIESVLIREKNHWTLCISTQVGCPMKCAFCLTGEQGFKRNLKPSEIVGQITALRFGTPEGETIKNIVMMGMGEPLLNYENVVKAIEIMTSDLGLLLSRRRVTVSTCGIVPMIYRLGDDISVNLAISLNAPDNSTRDMLMPVNKTYPLEDLIQACRGYPMPRRRRVTFEYILIADINDSAEHAKKIATLIRGIRCKFNLIRFNEYPGSLYKSPREENVAAFQNILVKHGYTAVIRKSKGRDILAACGQLSGQYHQPAPCTERYGICRGPVIKK
jgi:23S rRNA (adenine2503-C2)-methyltransferase